MIDKKAQRGAGVAAVFGRQPTVGSVDEQVHEPIRQHVVLPAMQRPDRAQEKKKTVKTTYYLDEELIKPLKFLAVERGKDLSTLANEAVRDLLAKYHNQ